MDSEEDCRMLLMEIHHQKLGEIWTVVSTVEKIVRESNKVIW